MKSNIHSSHKDKQECMYEIDTIIASYILLTGNILAGMELSLHQTALIPWSLDHFLNKLFHRKNQTFSYIITLQMKLKTEDVFHTLCSKSGLFWFENLEKLCMYAHEKTVDEFKKC